MKFPITLTVLSKDGIRIIKGSLAKWDEIHPAPTCKVDLPVRSPEESR